MKYHHHLLHFKFENCWKLSKWTGVSDSSVGGAGIPCTKAMTSPQRAWFQPVAPRCLSSPLSLPLSRFSTALSNKGRSQKKLFKNSIKLFNENPQIYYKTSSLLKENVDSKNVSISDTLCVKVQFCMKQCRQSVFYSPYYHHILTLIPPHDFQMHNTPSVNSQPSFFSHSLWHLTGSNPKLSSII